jgi:hypothetical protein
MLWGSCAAVGAVAFWACVIETADDRNKTAPTLRIDLLHPFFAEVAKAALPSIDQHSRTIGEEAAVWHFMVEFVTVSGTVRTL